MERREEYLSLFINLKEAPSTLIDTIDVMGTTIDQNALMQSAREHMTELGSYHRLKMKYKSSMDPERFSEESQIISQAQEALVRIYRENGVRLNLGD